MAFPQTELPLFVDIAPGGSPMGTTESWEPFWVDITRDVRLGSKVVIEEGIPDEANQADPGSCTLTLDNGISRVPATAGRLGCYTPRNPLGPYFGALAKNTPLRVRIQRNRDTFNRVSAVGWGTSDSGITYSIQSALYSADGTGRGLVTLPINTNTATSMTSAGAWDFDFTGKVAINALPDSGLASAECYQYVNFRRAANTNQYQFLIYWRTNQTVSLFVSRTVAGVTTQLAGVTTPTIGTVTPNTDYRFRLRVEGSFIQAKMWLASNPEPANYNINVTDSAYSLDNSGLGTNIQIQTIRGSATTTTSVFTWGDFRVNQYPFIGNVPEWPVRWDQSGNDSTGPLKATGVLRRLQQGKNQVKSPLYSFMDGLKPVGLWTLEDDSGATLAAAQTAGTRGATIYSSTPSGWTGPPKLGGTSGQYTVGVDTTISGSLPRVMPNGSWLAWFMFYMPVLPVTNPTIFRVRSSGTITQWDMKISDSFGGVMYLTGTAADGTLLVNQSITYTPGQWCLGQIEIQQTGSNFTARLVNYHIGTGAVSGTTSAAIAGNIGAPNAWSIYGSTGFQASAAGPVAFYPFIPGVNIANLQASARGFVGEDAATRIGRLAAERGIRCDLITGGRSSLMGVQSSDTFLSVTAEAADTDLGLLTEFRGGLRYRSRGRRYGQLSRMQLDFAAGHIKEPPEPTDDDQRLRNDITVTRKDGSSSRAYDSAHIAVNGLLDTEQEINPQSDDDLPGQAGFRLYLGTWNEMRWPSITLDLARNAGIVNYVERATALDPGAYVILSNPPTNLPVGPLRLLVEAVKTTLGPFEWTVELTCQPYTPWRITDTSSINGVIGRMDLVGSTLNSVEAALTVGATDTWTILNAGRNWDATQVPFDWDANGERVTVTALSGTGTQAATVTRGVNGIVKAHVVGEPIALADPMYVAL